MVTAIGPGQLTRPSSSSLLPFFEPRSVAVVGASNHRGKIGAEILHNLISTGFTGRLYAVHGGSPEIQGIPAFARVSAIPEAVDLVIVAVPAADVRSVVDDCIAAGTQALVIISAGFAETGEPGRTRERELASVIRSAGIRLVGPNCMGLLNTNPAFRLNGTFSPVFPPAGSVAMLSQSGALGLAVLDHAKSLGIGISTFVSIGNKADVSGNDLLQYWENDPRTDVIAMYLESFGNPRKFSQIARRVGRQKPIVVVKAGRSDAGARAAASHTGALAGSDAVVDALFHQCGVIRTDSMEQLFDVTRLLAQQPLPRGGRVAILTNAGGPAILAADACQAAGLEVVALSETTRAQLRAFLPAAASPANPVDMVASATAEHYDKAMRVLLADDGIDSIIAIFVPPLVTSGEDVARSLARAVKGEKTKPVMAVFMGSAPAVDLLRPIPVFTFPETAAAALARATRYGQWRRTPESSVPNPGNINRDRARRIIAAAAPGWLPAAAAQQLAECAGICVASAAEARDARGAADAAAGIGYPVALKAAGPRIIHKTEVGGVRLALASAKDVREAFDEMKSSLGADMTGALIQKMVTGGVEMLVGVTEDPVFGAVMACGVGGTAAELFADHSFALAPLTTRDADGMVDSLRCAPLLRGFRGAPVLDEAALKDVLLRLSALVTEFPAIREMEINPLRVLPSGVCALDVRARLA